MQDIFNFWNDSFWFTEDELAEIFEVSETDILNKFSLICSSNELLKSEVSAKNKSGKLFLNLDAAVSIAYRIDNVKATKFRIETGEKLLEEILKNRTARTARTARTDGTDGTDGTNMSNMSNMSKSSKSSKSSKLSKSSNSFFPKHGGYKNLKSYQLTVIIYDATVVFCDRYISKFSRTVDQMTQAARSGKQNIAEGSMASATSKKTELKLINVAKSSLEELLEDYEDYLRQNNLEIWEKTHPEVLKIRKLAYIQNKSYLTYKDYFENNSSEQFANCVATIIHQAIYLIDRQLESLGKSFLENGGFTENLYKKRKEYRKSKPD